MSVPQEAHSAVWTSANQRPTEDTRLRGWWGPHSRAPKAVSTACGRALLCSALLQRQYIRLLVFRCGMIGPVTNSGGVCMLCMCTWQGAHMCVNIWGHHCVHMGVRVCGHMTGVSTHTPGAPRWGLLVPWSSVSTEYTPVSRRPPLESRGSCPLPHQRHLGFPKWQFPGPIRAKWKRRPGAGPASVLQASPGSCHVC